MPLRDHFHPPFSKMSSWEGFHGGWPMVIVQQLGRVLPRDYVAEPRVHLGSQVEVDVATYEGGRPAATRSSEGDTALWAPTAPSLAVETELADFDEYEVRIYNAAADRRLVAAIELISPSNKDRPESRSQFVSKCAALLRREISVVLVDVVTERHFNLYAELMELVGEADPALGEDPPTIYAVSSRWRPKGVGHVLEAWNRPLTIGSPLPVLPLWLSEELAVPLDLEASYEQTCRDLRITQ